MRLPIIFSLALSLTTLRLSAQQSQFKNEFGFRSDNDAYLAIQQDHYYTNGLFLTFRHALPPHLDSKYLKKSFEVEAGQYMYNAHSGDSEFIEEIDRPFAAYLYAGGKFNWFSNGNSHLMAGLQVGTIGPDAYGKEAQETLHTALGFYTIHGWQFQVNNEIGLNTTFNYDNEFFKDARNSLILETYLNAGNTFSGLGAGVLYRTGKSNRLANSASFNSRISNATSDTSNKKESFFYARPMLNLVLYNATIQGGMFRSDKGPVTFKPNPLLFTQEIGYMYSNNRWTFNFSIVFQSKELKEQVEAQQYGSAAIYYRFN